MGSEQEINLRQYTYHGIVLEDEDKKNQGRYKIHIPELHPLIGQTEGIWCKNQQHQWRYTPSHDFMYGEYFPIQPGTKVLVKFYENDFHSGYIDRIISDQIQKTTPKLGCKKNPEATSDRDDIYLLYKTPKKHNLFVILEDTKDGTNGLTEKLIPNSIHLYYNYRRTTLILNEDGIHWFTMDNRGVTVEGHNSEWVNKSEKVYVKDTRDIYVAGSYMQTYVGGDEHRSCKGERRDYSKAQMSLVSGALIAEDAPTIWLNSGKSKTAKKAKTNKGEDQIVKQNKIDMRIIAHQNKDDTYYGVEKYKIEGGTPTDNHPDKSAVKLSKGLNDRYSSVGAEQCGASITQPPPYPSDGDGGGGGGMLGGVGEMFGGGASELLGSVAGESSIFSSISGGMDSVIGGATGGLTNSLSGLTGNFSGLTNSLGGIGSLGSLSGSLSQLGGISSLSSLSSLGGLSGSLGNLGGLTSSLGNLGGLTSSLNTSSLTSSLGSLSGLANVGSLSELSSSLGGIGGVSYLSSIGSLGNLTDGLHLSSLTDSSNLTSLTSSATSSFTSGLGLSSGLSLDSLSSTLGNLSSGINIDSLSSNLSGFTSGLSSMLGGIGGGFTSVLSGLSGSSGGLTSSVGGITDNLESTLGNITSGSNVDSLFGDLTVGLGVDSLSDNLSTQLGNLPSGLVSGTGGLDALVSTVTAPITAVNSLANIVSCTGGAIVNGIKSSVSEVNSLVNGGLGMVLGAMSGGVSVLSNAFGSLDNLVSGAINQLNMNNLFGTLTSAASSSNCNNSNVLDWMGIESSSASELSDYF